MSSKTAGREDPWKFFSRLYERGEEAMSQVVEELLKNPKVTDRLGKTIGQAFDAKRRVDRNLQFLLSLLNLPSRTDYNRLMHKIEALQGSMVNLSMKMDRLLAAVAEKEKVKTKRSVPADTRRVRKPTARPAAS